MLRNRFTQYYKVPTTNDAIDDSIEMTDFMSNNNPLSVEKSVLNLPPSAPPAEVPVVVQHMEPIIVDKTLDRTLQTEFEVVELPFTDIYPVAFDSLEINCTDCTINVYKNEIVTTKPVLVSLLNKTLRVWTPNYTENRVFAADGSTILNGYIVFDYDGNKLVVKDKVILKNVPISFSPKSVNITGDSSIVSFDDKMFDGAHLKVKVRGYNSVRLGECTFASIDKDVQSTVNLL